MGKKQVIKKVALEVKRIFLTQASGHDWQHIELVWKNAKKIAATEKSANLFIVELTAICHELGDYKLEKSHKERHALRIREVLVKFPIAETDISEVVNIVGNMSFSKNIGVRRQLPLEGRIVQDADRLEALGAIGIARVFSYGGHKGNLIYDPGVKPNFKLGTAAYKKSKGTSINHFYEKLLLLKGRMNTKEGKKIAGGRHKFLELYLREFFAEWKGIK